MNMKHLLSALLIASLVCVFAVPNDVVAGNKVIAQNVTTNTTSAAVTLTIGTKGIWGQVVCSSGPCTQTQEIYGDIDDDAANGVLLCTITLSGTPRAQDMCPPFMANTTYIYVTTTATTGNGATGEIHVLH